MLVVGSRLSDFTTASKTAFAAADVRFVNINVAELDAHKHAALPLIGDARVDAGGTAGRAGIVARRAEVRVEIASLKAGWEREVDEIYRTSAAAPLISQGEVIGIVNEFSAPDAVVVCAAGSLPGDLHKLWRTRDAQAAITSSTAIPAWATRSPVAWASAWRSRTATSTSWWATGRI